MKIQFKSITLIGALSALFLLSCGTEATDNKAEDTGKDSSVAVPVKVANAGDVTGAKIAWANSDTVSKYYTLANELRKNLEEQQMAAQTTLEGLYGQFEKKQKALEKEAPILGQTELQQKYQDLQILQQTIMEKEQGLQQELNQKEYAATTSYISLTNEFMQEIGAKLGYDYVFSYQAGGPMMFGNPNLDITDEIISELNNAYKNHGGQ